MAKKRRRPRTRPSANAPPGSTGQSPAPAPPRAAVGEQRRAHKEEARRAREASRKRAQRRRVVSRTIRIGLVAAVAVAVVLFLTRAGAPGDVPEAALQAAEAAGCGDVRTPAGSAPGSQHLPAGQTFTYDQHPATSGQHAPAPLPAEPHVYTSPVPETNAVHNLEHAYVLIYYRADGPDALPSEVVDELARLAESEDKVIMAPHPSLDQGTSLALTAWNKLWECPAGVSSTQARTISSGFIDAYRGTSNAPEPGAP